MLKDFYDSDAAATFVLGGAFASVAAYTYGVSLHLQSGTAGAVALTLYAIVLAIIASGFFVVGGIQIYRDHRGAHDSDVAPKPLAVSNIEAE